MKLLHVLWLLGILVLVSGQQKPTANSATKDAPVVANATNVLPAKVIAGSKLESGSPGAASQLVPENAGKAKNLTNTDTGVPTIPLVTSKPAVEQKAAKEATSTTSTTTSSTTTTTTAKPAAGSAIVTEGQSMKDVTKPNNSSTNGGAISPTNSTHTATATTKAVNATIIATTPKPMKPPLVFSTDIHQEGEDMVELEKGQDKPGTKGAPTQPLATPPEPLVQGLTGSNLADHGENGYVVPIVTVLLTVPLAIGVVTIMYRRFRDMWSTRHYRRMDFLVDGMYND
ncbi:salivary glue protein Sgs-3 [Drosophila simulans]|uniref:GD17426 n=1 Tax=Drosophila simulans TaxID=7240 RepID=B4R7B3_DROSI|nr:salivary glue protein Sgs-3 [Drosophila simulans]EDX18354.1 GD17426 [Drosophila simulans]